jgi:ribonuclease BN (tRNA processing enzyme)
MTSGLGRHYSWACTMRLTVIGSADAFNSCGRGHSCYVVESEGLGKLMIDFGPTALAGLRRAGFQPHDLSAIALTHLHGDHAGGLPFLFIDGLFNDRRTTPLPLLGPTRTRETLDALVDATYADIKSDLSRLELDVVELLPGETRELAGYTVQGFAADHMKPPHRPLCLRVTDPAGVSVAFSGDTRVCPGLFEAASGTNLLVAECTRLAPPAGHHCTWEEWKTVLPEVRAKAVLFTHLGADVRNRLPGLEEELDGSVVVSVSFADDGMTLDLT